MTWVSRISAIGLVGAPLPLKAKREFIWHSHEETDEMFFIVEGQMKLATREKVFELEKGELIVVPKGVEHKPICDTAVSYTHLTLPTTPYV